MIDFHSHILWGVDDGALNYNETLDMLNEAKSVGFKKVISTSHYKENRFEVPQNIRKKFIKQIKIDDIEILLGSEIFFNENIFDNLNKGLASRINNSKYILIEFLYKETNKIPPDCIDVIIKNGYIPIIAHPERYPFIQEEPDYIKKYLKKGALLQANYGSILGVYGSKAKITLKYFLNNKWINFLGSDAHRKNTIYPRIPDAIKKIKKIITDEEFEVVSSLNPQKILNNEDL